MEKLKAEQADELDREAFDEAGKTVNEAKKEMHQLRLEHAAENAKLLAKIKILEQQHAQAIDDQHEAFVRGW
eukprot:3204701-Pleurochrysis_carterae.AAC.1